MILFITLFLAPANAMISNKFLDNASCEWYSPTTSNEKSETKYGCSYDKGTGTLTLNEGKINWVKKDTPGLGFTSDNYRIHLTIDCKTTISRFYTVNEDGFRKWEGNSEIESGTKIKDLWSNAQVNGKLKFILVETKVGEVETNHTLFFDMSKCTFDTISTEGVSVIPPSTKRKSNILGENDVSTFTVASNNTLLFSDIVKLNKDKEYPKDGYRSAIRISNKATSYKSDKGFIRRFKDGNKLEEIKISKLIKSKANEDPYFDYFQEFEKDFNAFDLLIVSWSGVAYDDENIFFKAAGFDEDKPTPSPKGGLSGGAIAGIVIASVAVVSAGVVGIVFVLKRKAKIAN